MRVCNLTGTRNNYINSPCILGLFLTKIILIMKQVLIFLFMLGSVSSFSQDNQRMTPPPPDTRTVTQCGFSTHASALQHSFDPICMPDETGEVSLYQSGGSWCYTAVFTCVAINKEKKAVSDKKGEINYAKILKINASLLPNEYKSDETAFYVQ